MSFNRILIVCTGNICRSPMAEGLWRHRLAEQGKDMQVASAGIGALVGEPPADHAITTMREWHIDITDHRARQLELDMAREYDLILVMEQRQQQWIEARMPVLHGRVQPLAHWSGGDIFDPYQGPEREFRQVRGLIAEATEAWIARLLGRPAPAR